MLLATPSTQVWNPSTDLQKAKTFHLGIDNYFTTQGTNSGGYALPTDLGLTYGLSPEIEIGVDIFLPQDSPFVFNAKYALPESSTLPVAVAVGAFGFGTQAGATNQNVIYGLIAKNFEFGRLSAGYFMGNPDLLTDNGAKDNAGPILTWDKAINDKLWVCIDYAGTKSSLGSLFYGFSWMFDTNTSILFGYGTYNNGAKPTFTTQLDINL